MKNVATIDENGQLQVLEEGSGHSIYVVASVEFQADCAEKNNYTPVVRKTQLDIIQTKDLLKFEEKGNVVTAKELCVWNK